MFGITEVEIHRLAIVHVIFVLIGGAYFLWSTWTSLTEAENNPNGPLAQGYPSSLNNRDLATIESIAVSVFLLMFVISLGFLMSANPTDRPATRLAVGLVLIFVSSLLYYVLRFALVIQRHVEGQAPGGAEIVSEEEYKRREQAARQPCREVDVQSMFDDTSEERLTEAQRALPICNHHTGDSGEAVSSLVLVGGALKNMFNVLWEIVFGMSDDLAPPTEGIYRFERLVNLKVTLVNLFGMVVSLYGIFFFDLDGGVANAELTAANLKNLEKLMQSGQPPLQKRRGSSVPENGSEAEAPAKEETLLEKKKK